MNQSRTALIVDDEDPLLRPMVWLQGRAGSSAWPGRVGSGVV